MLIIVNPSAGRSSRRPLDRVVEALLGYGCIVVLRRAGPMPGDVERLAREAEPEFDVIVAAGGDGTLNAIVNGLRATPRPVALLPFGTANVLARDIGLPRRPGELAALIARGAARPVWPGRVGDRLFLTVASCGFDAETVAAVDPRLKRHVGRLAFVWAILKCLLCYRDRQLTVSVDGIDYRAAAVIAAKGRYYAGPFVVAPHASLAEPMLDLVLFQRSGRWAVLRYLVALVFGRLSRRGDIASMRGRSAVIRADEPVPMQADGELVGHPPVTLGIAERPLLLVQP